MSNKKTEKKTAAKKQTDKKQSSKKGKEKKSYKKLIITFVIVDILLVIGIGVAFLFNIFNFSDITDFIEPDVFVDDTDLDEENGGSDTAVKTLSELRNSSGLSDCLKNWAVNDYDESALMSSKDVINFLLVGVDASGGNSDVMMLLSLDKENGKIYLNSFMRDSYTYIKTSKGDRYAKLNAAYANGGMSCLIETVQMDYKIKIDNYVLVNFNTFVDVVDTIGGIELDVQKYEAKAAGLSSWGENTHLTGKEALMFCRIRKCDSDGDVSRTRRQRQFITAVIDKTKTVGVSQISDILNSLLKYVKTDCSTSRLISLATQALLGKWYDFEIVSQSLPLAENRMDYLGYSWVWIVDYPADARALQLQIYGKSNIELSDDRVSAIDLMKSGNKGSVNP